MPRECLVRFSVYRAKKKDFGCEYRLALGSLSEIDGPVLLRDGHVGFQRITDRLLSLSLLKLKRISGSRAVALASASWAGTAFYRYRWQIRSLPCARRSGATPFRAGRASRALPLPAARKAVVAAGANSGRRFARKLIARR